MLYDNNNLNSLLHIYSFRIGKIKFTFVRNMFVA